MKKKQMKIVKSDLFKEQEKNLPSEVKKELKKALTSIVKNPTKAQNTMSLGGKPTVEELKQWMGRVQSETIDLVFEYLADKSCLNKRGVELAQGFYDKYIKKK